MGVFTLPKEEYKRDMNLFNGYVQQVAFYLARMSGRPLDECATYVKANIKSDGRFPIRDPQVTYLAKETAGNRQVYHGTLGQYLSHIDENDNIVAPTLTVYLPAKKKESLLAEYILGNLLLRKGYKKSMFAEKMKGNAPMEGYFDNLQNTCKIKNNSMSGAHASPFTVLYNKTAHSTLTSTCRSAASYGNAQNEKFLMGNRHYWSYDVTMGAILSITQSANYDAVLKAMLVYNLHYPTAEETMECIQYSTKHYWVSREYMSRIQVLVERLQPIERAAFVYTSDLYHLAKHNPTVVRSVLEKLSATSSISISDFSQLDKYNGDTVALACLLVPGMKGRLLGDVKKDDPELYALVVGNAKKVDDVVNEFAPLIQGLWRPAILPGSIATLPSILRKCVVVSDTDSTIFTTQYWTEWYVGKLDFSPQSYAIGYTATFLTSQCVIHLLAMMSANMGVDPGDLHRLSMKNEYYFPVFTLTSQAKHYFAKISAQEGNVFAKMKTEIKGVALRSSNAPPEVNKRLEKFMNDIMEGLMERGQLSIHEVLGPVYEVESDIIADINAGGHKYLRSAQIKGSESYVDGEKANPFLHYMFWEDVFGDKYGHIEPPPYHAVKVSVDLSTPKRVTKWIEAMKDREIADRITKWMGEYGKDKITMFLLPQSRLVNCGVPLEIVPAIEHRKLVYEIVSPFYLVLESLGIYMTNPKHTRLISDTYIPPVR
jgi:hypothetical protein